MSDDVSERTFEALRPTAAGMRSRRMSGANRGALRKRLIVVVAGTLLVVAPLRAQSHASARAVPTAADLRYALRDSVFGWVSYDYDGTAAGDTTRRLAAAAMWEMEGGDQSRGIRLFQAALDRGVSDSLFYVDAQEVMTLLRCPGEAVELFAESRRRWPGTAWADSGLARAEQRLRKASLPDQRRTCPVRVRRHDPPR